jgi:hypothetical protein
VSIVGVLNGGEEYEASAPGAQYSVWVDRAQSQFAADPEKGDLVAIPPGITGYRAGDYLVVDRDPDGRGGIYLHLQYVKSI